LLPTVIKGSEGKYVTEWEAIFQLSDGKYRISVVSIREYDEALNTVRPTSKSSGSVEEPSCSGKGGGRSKLLLARRGHPPFHYTHPGIPGYGIIQWRYY